MEVTGFRIQESVVNKGCFILIAKTTDGKEWVCNGDSWNPTYMQPIETAFDIVCGPDGKRPEKK